MADTNHPADPNHPSADFHSADWREHIEALTLKGQIKLPYTWSVGETGSRFLVALRDEEKILANRCPQCGAVYVPPRKNCGACFVDIGSDDWLEVGPEGVVTAFTIVHYAYPLQPTPPPFAYALIQLDSSSAAATAGGYTYVPELGPSVGFVHIIKDGLDQLKAGVRVRARFRDQRTGQILDIDRFEII